MEIANISLWVWGGFLGFVLLMLGLDLGVFHRKAHRVETKEALTWCAIWVSLAMAFAASVFFFWDRIQPGSNYTNSEAGLAFLAGYVVEYALSIDNIFVFLVVFAYFKVPDEYQHRVLFWGIIGALVFRALFIVAGAALLEHFAWMMVLFGLFLILTGVKLAVVKDKKFEPERNPIVRLFRKIMPVTNDYVGQSFFTRIDKRLWATPLFIVLLVVEMTDIVFAVDSIPAIFAITTNPFIVFTSNVFAILGLRSLFFALSGLMGMFRYLSYGLAAILVFVGLKMIYGYVEKALVSEWPKFPIALSLGVIVLILASSVVISILRPLPNDSSRQP